MKTLQLTNSTDVALLDDEDYDRCNILKWYCEEVSFCVKIRMTTEPYRNLSNYIMKDFSNIYDHKNRNGLDNQKINLRICTHRQNTYNRGKQDYALKPYTSNYKGVSWEKGRKIWQAYIIVNCKKKHLGRFTSEDKAAEAYNKAAKIFFKEFACLNVIPEE